MKPTIHDVAKLSGVSIGTVSRVLNSRPGVKQSTKEKVLRIVDEIGYVPESAARDLSKGSSLSIGIHLKEGTLHLGPFSVLFFQNVMRKAMNIGARIIDLPSRPDGLPFTNVDGMVLLGAHQGDPRIDFLEAKGIPYVLVGHHIGKSWIAPDDKDGGEQVGRYLLKCGHKKILYITSRLDFQANSDRFAGLQETLEPLGYQIPPERILTGVDTPLGAYRKFREFAQNEPAILEDVTAIFASSDELATGVRAALEDIGKSVPMDYSIVGFDDLPEIGGDLTTVHQNIPQIAEISLNLLIEQVEGKAPRNEIVPVQLVVRDSSGLNLRKR